MIPDSDPLPQEPTTRQPPPVSAGADDRNRPAQVSGTHHAGSSAFTVRNWRWLTAGRQTHSTTAVQALEDMVAWVDWLIGRYRLGHTIPPCWWAHGPMVEELSALEAAWRGAYEAPDAPPDAGVVWHEQLGRALLRIEEWNVESCTSSDHRPVADHDRPTDLGWPRHPSRTSTYP